MTPLQMWQLALADLLVDARADLSPRAWAMFVEIVTSWVAHEQAQLLDDEERWAA